MYPVSPCLFESFLEDTIHPYLLPPPPLSFWLISGQYHPAKPFNHSTFLLSSWLFCDDITFFLKRLPFPASLQCLVHTLERYYTPYITQSALSPPWLCGSSWKILSPYLIHQFPPPRILQFITGRHCLFYCIHPSYLSSALWVIPVKITLSNHLPYQSSPDPSGTFLEDTMPPTTPPVWLNPGGYHPATPSSFPVSRIPLGHCWKISPSTTSTLQFSPMTLWVIPGRFHSTKPSTLTDFSYTCGSFPEDIPCHTSQASCLSPIPLDHS